jgi:hypothetical protein
MRLVKWRNPWAVEWGRLLSERVSGNEDGGTGREQGVGPGMITRPESPMGEADEIARLREENGRLRTLAHAHAANIREMQLSLERKNRQLDALHLVWCDGGCPRGVHRYQDDDVLVTEELVAAAERNTKRLRRWYEAVKFRHETYRTASEWHRQYAARAAARTDLGRREPQ